MVFGKDEPDPAYDNYFPFEVLTSSEEPPPRAPDAPWLSEHDHGTITSLKILEEQNKSQIQAFNEEHGLNIVHEGRTFGDPVIVISKDNKKLLTPRSAQQQGLFEQSMRDFLGEDDNSLKQTYDVNLKKVPATGSRDVSGEVEDIMAYKNSIWTQAVGNL